MKTLVKAMLLAVVLLLSGCYAYQGTDHNNNGVYNENNSGTGDDNRHGSDTQIKDHRHFGSEPYHQDGRH